MPKSNFFILKYQSLPVSHANTLKDGSGMNTKNGRPENVYKYRYFIEYS
jgi:hypothetical protein